MLDKLYSYHQDIEFTHEEVNDENELYLLDIKLTSNGIFRNSTHTHRSHKMAWVRSHVLREYKICTMIVHFWMK